MAPDHPEDELALEQVSSESKAEAEARSADAALRNAKSTRKRTKTGCLTCRKRRIKCGEEQPMCKNCIKSRRQCEGYNKPVIFKPTWNIEPVGPGGAHITFQTLPLAGPSMPVVEVMPSASDPRAPNIRPRPSSSFVPGFDAQGQPMAGFEHYTGPLAFPTAPPMVSDPGHISHYSLPEPHPYAALHAGSFPQSIMHGQPRMDAVPFGPVHLASGQQPISPDFTQGELSPSYVQVPGIAPLGRAAFQYPEHYPGTPVSPLQPQSGVQSPEVEMAGRSRPWVDTSLPYVSSFDQAPRAYSMSHPLAPPPWTAGTRVPGFDVAGPPAYPISPTSAGHHFQSFHHAAPLTRSAPTTPHGYDQEFQPPLRNSPTYFLNSAAVETQDDDYYDVNSQEEMEDDTSASDPRAPDPPHALCSLLAMTQISVSGSQMRRYDTFLYHGILNHYRVEWVANPLRNAATARVFAHFISVTGPMLSLYERHPKNTSVLFGKGTIPFSQQGLWTYAMPMAALHHQGLLHAMLALASLHIARLQGASQTPSMQHYVWALKRVRDCVKHPKKRLKVTTIAASMLLGFYEVMTADHMKWSMHLAGSKQLYIETDFAKMTQEFRRMKLDKLERDQLRTGPHAGLGHCHLQDDLLDQMPDVDDRVISQFVGREVRYDNHGSVQMTRDHIPQELDLSEYASLRDLYWWYCRQDVIQSILSGNALLMDFSRWHNCPPRAPLGRADAVYGSYDHLLLILGRIANFAARDRTRKLRQMEVNGGQWQPAPGMKVPNPPPQQHNGHPPTPVSSTMPHPYGPSLADPSVAAPQFYGMTPHAHANVRMPASYTPAPPTSSPLEEQNSLPETDLQAETKAALAEHEQILAALTTFSTSLGETFEPLTSEYQPTMQTPFGTALFYRSYDIGCLWAFYYMAMIIAVRSHPHMPPAAHMAAGIAAPETAFFANEIGRITAGIVPGSSDDQLSPTLGAALNESCLPSFFAAVQYQEQAQRHFTVTRIFNIARRTGWGSAELIANGCETAWVRAAEVGRGPPYERVVRVHSSNPEDPRLNGSWEVLDPNMAPDAFNESDRRLVRVSANARLNWAIGVMGTEMDLEQMPIHS